MELLHGEHDPQKLFTYEDLEVLTNKFSRGNFIERTQLGMVFRGKIPEGWKGMKAQDVTVKLWQEDEMFRGESFYTASTEELRTRAADEINFLRQPIMESHPNLVKVMGYCFDGDNFGVVFDLNPLNTVHNLVAKRPFTWFHRMKVALALARLLEFLHGQQPRYLLRNLSAAHIMLDQDYNPILIDCAMILGGTIGDSRRAGTGCPLGSHGYIDAYQLTTTGEWSERNDVFSFGAILVELIVKCRVDGLEDFKDNGVYYLHQVVWHLYVHKKNHYEKPKYRFGIFKLSHANKGEFKLSLVNKQFAVEPDFCTSDGPKLTRLAVQCVDMYTNKPRPTAAEVVDQLMKLDYFCRIGPKLGLGNRLAAGSKRSSFDGSTSSDVV